MITVDHLLYTVLCKGTVLNLEMKNLLLVTTSKKMQKKCLWVFIATEFNITVDFLDAKKFVRYSQVLVLTELVVSGTQCLCTVLQYMNC